jgi:type I restriction enzyme R subunit
MSEFKQIIGRGTRLREDYEKLWFNIIDYTGSATQNFADPDFDGEPERIEEITIDADGFEKTQDEAETATPENEQAETHGEYTTGTSTAGPGEGGNGEPRKYYIDGGTIKIASHLVYELDAGGRQLRVIQYTDYTAEKVRTCSPLPMNWGSKPKPSEFF